MGYTLPVKNDLNKNKQITNIIVSVKNSVGYCSKCLRVLNKDSVKDTYGNDFCCRECRAEYWSEVRQDRDDCFGDWTRRD